MCVFAIVVACVRACVCVGVLDENVKENKRKMLSHSGGKTTFFVDGIDTIKKIQFAHNCDLS